MCTSILSVLPVLPGIRYQNGTVAVARREMTQFCI
ncbi:hypothetical protein E2C01_066841 [Portunus trituberculatus]|uniref:Uncharacterized protein n=1 Tax=Portunus trituberculatus TaxID=210409 RepID=A0A5B7HI80_PORTR|nr:hypothetical protein [Portunus trituberculatus]